MEDFSGNYRSLMSLPNGKVYWNTKTLDGFVNQLVIVAGLSFDDAFDKASEKFCKEEN